MYVEDNLNGEDNYEIKNMEMSINTCVYSPRLLICINWVYDVRLLLLMYVGEVVQ